MAPDQSLEDQLAELAVASRRAAELMAVRMEANALVSDEVATVFETRKFLPNLAITDLVAASGVNAGQIHSAGRAAKDDALPASDSATEAA